MNFRKSGFDGRNRLYRRLTWAGMLPSQRKKNTFLPAYFLPTPKKNHTHTPRKEKTNTPSPPEKTPPPPPPPKTHNHQRKKGGGIASLARGGIFLVALPIVRPKNFPVSGRVSCRQRGVTGGKAAANGSKKKKAPSSSSWKTVFRKRRAASFQASRGPSVSLPRRVLLFRIGRGKVGESTVALLAVSKRKVAAASS